jgi:hypothetical protein
LKIFDVANKVIGSGEYILGADVTGSHACYLIFGVLEPGEAGRELKPGRGHEEIILCIRGTMRLSGAFDGDLYQGQAVHLIGEEWCEARNNGSEVVVYVVSGGHAGGGKHH